VAIGKAAPPQDPIAFINRLTHTKGAHAGESFRLRPWQVKIIKQIFKKRRDGRRQYRTCLLMLPRKNGKSTLAAAIALYGLLADGEAGAEVYSAAADKDQAGIVFNEAAQMIRNDPALVEATYIVDSQKRIEHETSGGRYRAISAEAYTKWGYNPHLVVYDEMHAASDRRLHDVLSTSMGGRTQPLYLIISTAGFDKHSILWELYSHAKKVQENPKLDPTFLPLIFEAQPEADWTDEKVWKSCKRTVFADYSSTSGQNRTHAGWRSRTGMPARWRSTGTPSRGAAAMWGSTSVAQQTSRRWSRCSRMTSDPGLPYCRIFSCRRGGLRSG
jgi:phage terminase large subunit-like protein